MQSFWSALYKCIKNGQKLTFAKLVQDIILQKKVVYSDEKLSTILVKINKILSSESSSRCTNDCDRRSTNTHHTLRCKNIN